MCLLLGSSAQRQKKKKNEEVVEDAALSCQAWGLPVGSLSSVNTRVNEQRPPSPTPSKKYIGLQSN